MSRKIDPAEKFWVDWLKADSEKRIRMVQKTMLAKDLTAYLVLKLKSSKKDRTFVEEMAARQINDFFEDLESVIQSRNHKL